jgi:hypothetical protein
MAQHRRPVSINFARVANENNHQFVLGGLHSFETGLDHCPALRENTLGP